MKHYELIVITCDRCENETVDGVELAVDGDEFDLCRSCWLSFKHLFIGGLRVDAVSGNDINA